MSAPTKRDATADEARAALELHAKYFNGCNPNHAEPLAEWEAKELAAVADGRKAEVCSCGIVFCAFVNWTTCRAEGCPFNCGRSMLDILLREPG